MKTLLFVLGLCVATSTTAKACQFKPITPVAGETIEQTRDKLRLQGQRSLWERSSAVFFAQVRDASGLQITLSPTSQIKGLTPPRQLIDRTTAECRSWSWKAGDVAIVYARRQAWNGDLLSWRKWEILDTAAPQDIRDSRIPSVKGGQLPKPKRIGD